RDEEAAERRPADEVGDAVAAGRAGRRLGGAVRSGHGCSLGWRHGDQRPRGASVTTGDRQLNPVQTACTEQQPLRYGRPLGHAPVQPAADPPRDLGEGGVPPYPWGYGVGKTIPGHTAPPHTVVPHRG
ncbi:hypothetical protein GTW46_35805, partial [Streptomyces sp. SID6013]|nr:hypothetical protein [Streptomyces sp. SID6013]